MLPAQRQATPPAYTPALASTPAAEAPTCANCGTPGPGAYCSTCGQEQRDYHRSLRAFAAELLDNVAGWDGTIPTTLWMLVRHPGRLTTEFLAGRRARYLRPLRLYLSTSLVFFLTLAATADDRRTDGIKFNIDDGPTSAAAAAPTRAGTPPKRAGGASGWLDRVAQERKRRLFAMPKQERNRALRQSLQAKLPNMVFALLPVFALLVRGLYWRRPVFYAEHLVFALHVHAFAMLVMTGARLTPTKWAAPAALLGLLVYVFVALQRVYGGSRRRTALRLGALGVAYLTAMTAALGVTAILAIALL